MKRIHMYGRVSMAEGDLTHFCAALLNSGLVLVYLLFRTYTVLVYSVLSVMKCGCFGVV